MSRTPSLGQLGKITFHTGITQPSQPVNEFEDILELPPEKRALLREYIAAVKPLREKGLDIPFTDETMARALFVREMIALMDKWGFYFDGDGNYDITSDRAEGQHYALDDDGDFRSDDGTNSRKLWERDDMVSVVKPAPFSAHLKIQQMAHRFNAIERFLNGEDV